MSVRDSDFFDYDSFCNSSLSDNDDITAEQFLEPLPNPFDSEPHWFADAKSVGRLNVAVLEPDRQLEPSTTPPSLNTNSTVWMRDLIGSSLFTPHTSEVIQDVPMPLHSQIRVEDMSSADVENFTEKMPNASIFAPADDDFEYASFINSCVENSHEHLL